MKKIPQNYVKIFSIDSKKVKMEKICYIFCNKYRKFKNLKISYNEEKSFKILNSANIVYINNININICKYIIYYI